MVVVDGCGEVELALLGSGRLDGRHVREVAGAVVCFVTEADVLAGPTHVVYGTTGKLVLMVEADLEPA